MAVLWGVQRWTKLTMKRRDEDPDPLGYTSFLPNAGPIVREQNDLRPRQIRPAGELRGGSWESAEAQIRTGDTLIFSQVLYQAELPRHHSRYSISSDEQCQGGIPSDRVGKQPSRQGSFEGGGHQAQA